VSHHPSDFVGTSLSPPVRAVATSVPSRAGTPQQRAAQTSVVCRLNYAPAACIVPVFVLAALPRVDECDGRTTGDVLASPGAIDALPLSATGRPASAIPGRVLDHPPSLTSLGPWCAIAAMAGVDWTVPRHTRCSGLTCDCLQGPLVVRRAAAPDLMPALETVAETGPSGAKV
jgi:hypothetical protein